MEILADVLIPSGFANALFCAGVVACFTRRTKAFSWWLLAASGALTLVFSSGMVAAALMSPLEYANGGLRSPKDNPEVRHIVVLTGWASDDPNLPHSAQMNASALYRVAYTLELWRDCPGCDVIVTGSEVAARVMGSVLGEMGIPPERIRIDGASDSTWVSAATLKTQLGSDPFFLVTSAGHMPRALGTMRQQELRAIPAPTDYQLPKDWRAADAKPSSFSLTVSDLAAHEYLGLIWYRLRGLL
jgi:uncharacterized SAM-binding protein YcdF (DUF218 family)